MKRKYSSDISIYDDAFIRQTIVSKMISHSLEHAGEYSDLLEKDPKEARLFIASLCNSYSEFFRNKTTFALLEQFLIPRIFEQKKQTGGSEIRIWSAACACGQEPYSLAMLIEDYRKTYIPKNSARIFATDISESSLLTATTGLYDSASVQNIKLAHVQDYFIKTGENYQVHEKIKKYIDFSFYDLTDEKSSSPPASIYGDFDLIFCANILFYYHLDIRNKILAKLWQTLNQGGVLVTGEAETAIVKSVKGFRQLMIPAPIFQKEGV